MLNKIVKVAAVGAVALTTLIGGTGTANALYGPGTYSLSNLYWGAGCMAPSSEVNGSQVVMEVPYCEQDWYFLAVSSNSSGTWYQINDQHGKCLDADLNHINSLGDKVQVWDCNGSAQQHWYAPNGNNTELINGANTNFVLDARTDGTWNPSMNGDPLQLYSPNGSPQQTWYELH